MTVRPARPSGTSFSTGSLKLPLADTREDYLALTPHYLDQVDFRKHSV